MIDDWNVLEGLGNMIGETRYQFCNGNWLGYRIRYHASEPPSETPQAHAT